LSKPTNCLQTATAGVPAFVRLGTAAFVSDNLKNFRNRPKKPIEVYEFEGCPFCRKVLSSGTLLPCIAPACFIAHDATFSFLLLQVREACTLLDIDVLFYPCPKGGPTWRPKVVLHNLCCLSRSSYPIITASIQSLQIFMPTYVSEMNLDMLQAFHDRFAASFCRQCSSVGNHSSHTWSTPTPDSRWENLMTSSTTFTMSMEMATCPCY